VCGFLACEALKEAPDRFIVSYRLIVKYQLAVNGRYGHTHKIKAEIGVRQIIQDHLTALQCTRMFWYPVGIFGIFAFKAYDLWKPALLPWLHSHSCKSNRSRDSRYMSDNAAVRTEKSRILQPGTVSLGHTLESSSRLAGWSNFTKLRTGADT
jgi:hypothetical protein